ncbi:hypothetical protein EV102420_22_00900 [Pseudescherichia vulneris NBRC 102420]|uniref:Uncharacterized protein n=1 Tax=Pseudescherichia vulneris NBRC 102420 TaxID=1115515 RepID=A0A090V907_PSEVU|nr:hypothetical protein [Pseudescherichia vulneris]GAL59769.1 hypothetical protein EV102420_22_00900 [Pseudescherichia vulneris NBRC 102420]STQ56881.1 Uncharacterised protein [Pseudescherichia vulneris]
MSWYQGYVKYINVDFTDGLMKIGISSNSDPNEEEPSIWFNLWPTSGVYSDLAKQMILNLRYAYIYGVKVTITYSNKDGGYILDSVDLSWYDEVNS